MSRRYRYLLGDSSREERRLRAAGPIDAVELSPVFAERLRRACARDGRGAGRIWNCALLDADLPRASYDLVFARWVFLFLPDPAGHLRKLARALRPGGLLAIEDYHRRTLSMCPTPAAARRLARGWRAAVRGRGSFLVAPAIVDVVGRRPKARR